MTAASSPRHSASTPRTRGDGIYAFVALACGLTWLLDLPLALAWMQRADPPPYAPALAGLSALGPTLAALVVAAPRRELGEVFGRWRTNPLWIAFALLVPMALHLPATLVEVALGGQPARWFYLPGTQEQVAALVMFPIGEEFGWRGFAYPRLARRYGLVLGSLILGAVWAIWHGLMVISPDDGSFDIVRMGTMAIELPLYCIVFAWVFERGNRSMAVAIALHMGAHLDNVYNSPATEVRLRVLRIVVLVVAAALAGRALAKKGPRLERPAPSR